MRRKRYSYKPRTGHFALNITSMTDMFTILLVFLLQTYSTADVQVIPEKDINLPLSNVESSPIKATNIALSRSELKIEGRTIASLENGDFASKDLDAHDSNFIRPLFNELQGLNQKLSEQALGKVLLQADASLSYQAIRKVMYTATMAGFPQLKMAAVAGE